MGAGSLTTTTIDLARLETGPRTSAVPSFVGFVHRRGRLLRRQRRPVAHASSGQQTIESSNYNYYYC